MSATLTKARSFLALLIDNKTLTQQKRSLLNTTNDNQLQALTLIAQNSLKDNIPINDVQKRKIHKYRKILKKIASKNLSNKSKKKLIKKHYKIILLILIILKELLERVII